MMRPVERQLPADAYVGTIVGESTSTEFRLAVAHEAVREQDIIAVDGELRQPDKPEAVERIRIWAKVQRIERLNPLFPSEAGHELAATHTDPFDTVLSLSREMVTAVCTVLGSEIIAGKPSGKLGQLRYPARPATRAYRPLADDIKRIVVGELRNDSRRALDVATLANRNDIDVSVDGHAIVSRHLAILAMTGAGKSWASRRIIEQLAERNYPIVIFDPHGDYTGLADVDALRGRVVRYYADFPIFSEDAETVASIISNLAYALNPRMRDFFAEVFEATKQFWNDDETVRQDRMGELVQIARDPRVGKYPARKDLWLIGHMAAAAEAAIRGDNAEGRNRLKEWGWQRIETYNKIDASTLNAVRNRTYSAAAALTKMESINRHVARSATPIPLDRGQVVQYGQISIVTLAGYTGDFQATIYSILADELLALRVRSALRWPVLLVLEEAHNFAPGQAHTDAESRAIATTKQIAQEGRKFGVGLVLITQRPSRLDETTLSQCNSFIVMRMVNPADQSFVRRAIESMGEDDTRLLPDLEVGEALLSGQMIGFPVLARMKEPKSRGEREEEDAFVQLEKERSRQSSNGYR